MHMYAFKRLFLKDRSMFLWNKLL